MLTFATHPGTTGPADICTDSTKALKGKLDVALAPIRAVSQPPAVTYADVETHTDGRGGVATWAVLAEAAGIFFLISHWWLILL